MHTSFSVNSGGGLVVTTRSNDMKSFTLVLLVDSARTVKVAASPSTAFANTDISMLKSEDELNGIERRIDDGSTLYSMKSVELPTKVVLTII